jgi:uncharacterized protein YdaU (DUF1376 family)
MSKPIWIKWYPQAWLSDATVCAMTAQERGAYFQLLNHQAVSGALPDNDRVLAALSGLNEQWSEHKDIIMSRFILSSGRWFNRKLESEIKKYAETCAINREKGIKSQKARKQANIRFNSGSTAAQPNVNEVEVEVEVEKENKNPSCSGSENQTPNQQKIEKIKYEEKHIELARHLARLIKENCPKNITLKKSQGPQWANTFRLMEKYDGPEGKGISLEEIKSVIDWAFTDDFWRAQIQSACSVRKHWNKLVLKKEIRKAEPQEKKPRFSDEMDWLSQ